MSETNRSNATKTNYIHGHTAPVLNSHSQRTAANSCAYLLPYLPSSTGATSSSTASSTNPALKILDVGCGPGTITIDLAQRVPQGTVIGIDSSAEAIAQAQQNAEEKGVKNVVFVVGNIFAWEDIRIPNSNTSEGQEQQPVAHGQHETPTKLQPSSFDIIHAHQLLQHLPDPLLALSHMRTLAKHPPQGSGILALRDADYAAMTWYPPSPGLATWRDLYINIARSLGCDPCIGRRLHALAMEAGFRREYIVASVGTWLYSTQEERSEWCGGWARRSAVGGSGFAERVREGWGVDAEKEGDGMGEERCREMVRAWRDLESEERGWFVVVHGEVVCWVR